MKRLMKCPDCGTYTLKQECPNCSSSTVSPRPAKYSPEDKYGDYRRRAKEALEKGKI